MGGASDRYCLFQAIGVLCIQSVVQPLELMTFTKPIPFIALSLLIKNYNCYETVLHRIIINSNFVGRRPIFWRISSVLICGTASCILVDHRVSSVLNFVGRHPT